MQVIYANVFVSFFAVFALRGVYFALLEETDTPRHLTGTTVGAVSFIGYTPEVFFGPLTGRILDRSPGLAGHQHYFLFLAGCALVGLLVAAWLVRAHRQAVRSLPPAR
jgi:MFS family permease